MTHVLDLVAEAIGLFISTDLDDVLLLLAFFSDPRFRVRQIAAGQFAGIAILYAISVVGSWVSFIIPRAIIGLLGLVPIAMGIKSAWTLWRSERSAEKHEPKPAEGPIYIATVTGMTLANGADNVSVYVPFFALRSGPDIALTGIVFGVMTALWLGLAYWLTRHSAIGMQVRRYTRVLIPIVFVALGLMILYQAGSITALNRFR
jgi:cadmium resistance protein CadD (predicted permease)